LAQNAEGKSFEVHAGFPCRLIKEASGNEVERLLETDYVGEGWILVHTPAEWRGTFLRTTFFHRTASFLWDGCVFQFGCPFERLGESADLKPSMNPLRTIILILLALMQAFPAQALRPFAMGTGVLCEMVCCGEPADEGPGTCECGAGGESPASDVSALPRALRESPQVAGAVAVEVDVLGRRPDKRYDEVRPARLARWRAHRPKVRLAVLFCSFLE
jgi:hypothetical protein